MKYLLKTKIILLILISLISCGKKKAADYALSYSKGYLIDRYSQYAANSWIPVSGKAVFNFSQDDGGILNISYSSYSDIYGDCTGKVVATLEASDSSALTAQTNSSNSGSYDVFTPYVVKDTVAVTGSNVVINSVYKATVSSISLTGCPFPNYSENYYIVTLYKNGTLTVTDWNRSKDYLLQPIK